ncbi:EamA family transporter [Paenibacillus nasutitermitis]|uniref:EamA family transporter n=1 Tax=Paenibacillus nasutitermitis TaxID=1652958 RepID=UPI001E2C708E|nr:EamA family transporter [Paenibacillus nasutitermitis]
MRYTTVASATAILCLEPVLVMIGSFWPDIRFYLQLFCFCGSGCRAAVYNLCLDFSFTGYPEKEWGLFLLLAIVPTLFGHFLFNWLLKYMKAASVSMTVLGEPIGAGVLAYFIGRRDRGSSGSGRLSAVIRGLAVHPGQRSAGTNANNNYSAKPLKPPI